MKKNINLFINVLNIKFLYCPLFIWLLIAAYEMLMLVNVLMLHPPWLFITSDMGNYIEKAQWFARGIFYEKYTTFYPQGTYYIFAIFFFIFDYFTALHLIAIFQTLCISAAIYILYRFVFDLFKSNTISTLAVIAIMMIRGIFSLGRFYLSENLFYVFMLFSLWMIYKVFFQEKPFKIYLLIIAAFLSGYTILIRPVILPGYLAIGVFLLLKHGIHLFRKQVILFILFGGIPVLLQSIYTSILLKRPSFFTSGSGYEILFGLSGYRTITSHSKDGNFIFTNNNYKFDNTIVNEVVFPYPLWENEGWMYEVKKLWKQDKNRVLKNILRNCSQVWKPVVEWPSVWRGHSEIDKIFVPIKNYAWIMYPLAIIGLLLLYKRNLFDQIVMLLLPVLGLQFTCLLRCGEPRYLVPFFWLIVIFMAYGLFWILKEIIFKNKWHFSLSLNDINNKTKTFARNVLIVIIVILFFVPIITWKIKNPDPKVIWYRNNEVLSHLKYRTLTSIPPYDVWSPRGVVKNSRLFGGTITVHNFEYTNGFFTNGDAELNFNLNGKYEYFETDMGIDQHADPGSWVEFRVFLDGKPVFPNYNNGIMQFNVSKYGSEPEHIKLDIKGCQKLTLRTFGNPDLSSWYNQGIWGGPIVY